MAIHMNALGVDHLATYNAFDVTVRNSRLAPTKVAALGWEPV